MYHYPLRRTMHTVVVLTSAFVLAGWALTSERVRAELPVGVLGVAASALLVAPLVVHLGFILTQARPEWRRSVPIVVTGSPDAWILVLVLTVLGPTERLTQWAIPALAAFEQGRSLTLVSAVVCLALRVVQLHRAEAARVREEGEVPVD